MMKTFFHAAAGALALAAMSTPQAASAYPAGLDAPAIHGATASADGMLAKRGRGGTGLRGRDRAPGGDDNPNGGDDGTPDQGSGDVAAAGLANPAVHFFAVGDDGETVILAKRGRGRGGDDGGRGRGRGGHDDDGEDDNGSGGEADHNGSGGNGSGSGRSKPRVPGGSGCDDPGDILEHSGCQV